MKMTRRMGWGVGVAWVALMLPLSASSAASIVTRMVTPGGNASTVTIAPGGAATFEVRIDAPAVAPIGASYRLTQAAPQGSGYLSVAQRTQTGSPFNDSQGGASDAAVTSVPGNLLAPDNNINVGNNTVGLAGTAPANNILVSTVTLVTKAATPPATYRIAPTPGVSFVTEVTTAASGNDIAMSDAYFDIVVIPLAACTFVVTPTDLANVPAAGGVANVTVTTPSGCPVAASSFQPWVGVGSITPNGGITTVQLQIGANNGAARASSLVLAGRLFLVTQSGP